MSVRGEAGSLPCEMNSMFSAARTSSPKWMVSRPIAVRAALKFDWPPGKYSLAALFFVTSHGSRRSEMLITWSRLPPSPSGAQKASMELYSPEASSWKERRFSMSLRMSSAGTGAVTFVWPIPKNMLLPPAT